MKRAEDFKKSFGEPDESFRYCVRQTLITLEREEEKPVKKKMSVGLVLVLAIMIITVTAIAAEQWGILNFAREHGEELDPQRLVTDVEQYVYKLERVSIGELGVTNYKQVPDGSELVDISVDELLIDEGWLYFTMMIRPKQEKTMVVADTMQEIDEQSGRVQLNYLGRCRDLNEPGSMKYFLSETDENAALSVKEYTNSKGFERVVRVAVGSVVKHWDCSMMEDGSLRMIVQMEMMNYCDENSVVPLMKAHIPLVIVSYGEDGLIPKDADVYENVNVWAVGNLLTHPGTKTSKPEDAHDIVGYRGKIMSVFVTPVSDDQMSVIIQTDREITAYGLTAMTGPAYVILDENGEVLYELENYRAEGINYVEGDIQQERFLVPREGLSEDKITIRLQNRRNYNIIYDEYTYTLE